MNTFTDNLRELIAAVEADENGMPVQRLTDGVWTDVTEPINWRQELRNATCLRPKPEPISVPWSKPEDVPLNCWARRIHSQWAGLVLHIDGSGFLYGANRSALFGSLEDFEWSTDRKVWHKCEVTA